MQFGDGDPLVPVDHRIEIAWPRYANFKRILTSPRLPSMGSEVMGSKAMSWVNVTTCKSHGPPSRARRCSYCSRKENQKNEEHRGFPSDPSTHYKPSLSKLTLRVRNGFASMFLKCGPSWRCDVNARVCSERVYYSSALCNMISEFYRRSLARNRASTAGVLAVSGISLRVLFNSILKHAAFNFLYTFSVNFHDERSYRRFETTEQSKRWRRRLLGSFASVSTLFRSRKQDQAFAV